MQGSVRSVYVELRRCCASAGFANEEPEELQVPGGWSGWEELPHPDPAQETAPEQAPKDLEEGELDEDAEAEFAPEGAITKPLVYPHLAPCL